MTDSPTRRKRYGAGICWEYMDKGTCPCETGKFPDWHPKLSLKTATTTTSSNTACTIASMPKRIPEWIESLKYLGFVEGDPANFAILDTTYEEREEAKAIGASFSPGMKKWIVVQGQDLGPFAKWHPRIHNRPASEFVLHNPHEDLSSAVRELQRCGVHPSQLDVRGSDGGAEILQKEISAMQQGNRTFVNDNQNQLAGGALEKRRLEFHGQNTASAGEYSESASAAKRLRFSTPESMQTFVREKQDEQTGGTEQSHSKVVEEASSEKQNELSALLSTAKSTLVRCTSAGGISKEQKHFNEAIFNAVEALAAKISSAENNETRINETSSAEINSMQKMVTPTEKAGITYGKPPGAPDSWYDFT